MTGTGPPDGRGRPSGSYTGGAPANELAATLSDLARALQDEISFEDTLDGIVGAAVQTVPGAQYAGISLVRSGRKMETPAATDDVVREVDRAQYETGQGPCLEAAHQRHTIRLPDMAEESRWPAFTGRALALGVRSMLSFQLFVEHGNLGALNLYSEKTDAFGDESEHVGLLFAAHAAVAMVGAQQQRNMLLALTARDLIGQAKGILMERHRVTAEQAFALLVRASQRTNTRLAEVALRLAESGELPGSAPPG